MSDQITWEECPHCGHPAAVGWVGEVSVEFDCRRGCTLPDRQIRDTPWRGLPLIDTSDRGRPVSEGVSGR
ncbi:MAG: hypothetical protein ACXVX8_03915 [Blastococcus sp.]